MSATELNAAQFRRAMGKFATGVTVVTFRHGGEAAGMTANAFMSLSVAPPMILISVRNGARFAQQVKEGERFGVSFLADEQQGLSRHFGGQPRPQLDDPFEFFEDVPLIGSALVRMVVRTHAIHAGGDHRIYTAHVEHLDELDGQPLLFFGGKYKQLHTLDPAQCWNGHAW